MCWERTPKWTMSLSHCCCCCCCCYTIEARRSACDSTCDACGRRQSLLPSLGCPPCRPLLQATRPSSKLQTALYLSQSAKHSMPSHARIPVTVHRPHGATKALSQQLSDTQRPARKLPAGSLCSGRSHSASKSLEFLISVPVTTPPRRSMDCRPVGRRPEHLISRSALLFRDCLRCP